MIGGTETEGRGEFYPQPDLENRLEKRDVQLQRNTKKLRGGSPIHHCASLQCVTVRL